MTGHALSVVVGSNNEPPVRPIQLGLSGFVGLLEPTDQLLVDLFDGFNTNSVTDHRVEATRRHAVHFPTDLRSVPVAPQECHVEAGRL